MRAGRSALVLLAVAVNSAGAVSPVDAAPRKFKNCTAMRRVHPHGVAKSKAAAAHATRLTGKPTVNEALYLKNKGLDRDKDGAACEK